MRGIYLAWSETAHVLLPVRDHRCRLNLPHHRQRADLVARGEKIAVLALRGARANLVSFGNVRQYFGRFEKSGMHQVAKNIDNSFGNLFVKA